MKILNFNNDFLTNFTIGLYNDLNNNNNVRILSGFESWYNVISSAIDTTNSISTYNIEKERIVIPDINNNILIGFSSGFDSVYHALKLKHCGYNPILFHFKHLNKSYPDEYDKAFNFAKEFDFDIVVVELEHDKNSIFIDNPIKNQLILSYMIEYGAIHNINKFALGNNKFEKISECRVQYGISDSIEMFEAFRLGVSNYYSNLQYFDIDKRKVDCYKFVATHYPQAFKYVNSCITPHRFKKHLNNLNSNKFNIQPLSNTRCLSCYKCAIESIVLNDCGHTHYPQEFIEHCYNVIRKKSDTIFTTKVANKNSTNDEIRENIYKC